MDAPASSPSAATIAPETIRRLPNCFVSCSKREARFTVSPMTVNPLRRGDPTLPTTHGPICSPMPTSGASCCRPIACCRYRQGSRARRQPRAWRPARHLVLALCGQVWYSSARKRRGIRVSPTAPSPSIRRFSSAVEQRFCKPKVGSSILSTGTSNQARTARNAAFHYLFSWISWTPAAYQGPRGPTRRSCRAGRIGCGTSEIPRVFSIPGKSIL
jgi:hypothetical protein